MKFCLSFIASTTAILITRRDVPGVTFYSQLKQQSDPITSSVGFNEWKKNSDEHPIDYYVPNFGQDHTIRTNFESLDWAEKQNKHKWIVKPLAKKEEPV